MERKQEEKIYMKKIMSSILTAVLAWCFFLSSSEAAAYVYRSEKYGFSIECPQEPVAILDLALTSDQKGVMMVYENEGMNVTYDWIILTEAFDNDTFPDFSRIDQQQLDEFLKSLVKTDYGFATVVPIEKRPAVYMLGIHEDVAKVYFTGANGQHYGIVMHTLPQQFEARINEYQQGLVTFKSF